MSRENVEVMRRLVALVDQGDDWPDDLLPPDFVLDFSRRLLNPVVVRGRDKVRAFVESEGQMWEGDHLSYELKELIDAGDNLERVDVPRRQARRVDVLRR